MSKHNSRNPNYRPPVADDIVTSGFVTEEEEICEDCLIPDVETATDVVDEPMTAIGTVYNCSKLNVRSEPSVHGRVIGILDAGTEVEVDLEFDNEVFRKVTTAAGIEGYCVKSYIAVHS